MINQAAIKLWGNKNTNLNARQRLALRFGEQPQIITQVAVATNNRIETFVRKLAPRVRKRGSSQSSLFRYCERTWKFVYRVRGQSFSQVRHLVLRYVSLSNNRSIRSRRSENTCKDKRTELEHEFTAQLKVCCTKLAFQ